ncbi:tetratricopeptide repeat protein [Lacipirellula limnantheis]|uniref:Tetratricopeptide repeat protein n=1 Tax=Lacipirellula limnantheis TaxID=2528024 RepID=A0A517TS42_9BACT|nr:tetratricopeptide repeat protein [Lacipirellula limnantheis]QDT71194.1 Tetratricopeptide repeat protein [Lacipirellula limnantheis]
MQRYRVNYPLLAGLVVGSVVLVVASFFLWRYQVDKNATRLIAKADAAEASGNLEEAFESLQQYVQLRPRETEARVRLGEVAIKITDDESLAPELRGKAFQIVVAAVRDSGSDPDFAEPNKKLRRKLVDIQTKFGAPDLALGNINQLLDQGVNDPELKALKAQCLFATQQPAEAAKWSYQLIGYDHQTDAFDAAKAQAPDKPLVYAMLASYLNEREPELAKRIIDQMIVANPESTDAYVLQYQFLKNTGNNEEARAALDKAFALKPNDAAVLNAKGAEAISDFQQALADAKGESAEQERKDAQKHLAEAAKFFAKGMEEYPDRIDFFERAARIETFRDKPEDALAIVEKGLAAFPMETKFDRLGLPAALGLANIKVEVLISKKDFEGVKKEVAALRELGNERVNAVADFHQARMTAVDEKWADAAAQLAAVRPRLLGFSELQALAAAIQGFCHTQLGQFDLALEAYKAALAINPELPQAKSGQEQILAMIGQDQPEEGMLQLDREIKDMLAKPKAEQNWEALATRIDDYIDAEAAKRVVATTWAPSRKALLRGQMLAMRAVETKDPAEQKQLFTQAREAIKKAYAIDPNDPTVQIQAIRLLAQEPDSGPAKALELLDSIVKKGKDSAAFRTLRIDLLSAIRDEKLPAQLIAATEGMDAFPDNQKALVWAAVAGRFEQLGDFTQARRALEEAAKLSPNSLPTRNALFDLALRQNDDPGMRAAQEKVLEIVKSKNDPGYVLTEVKRRLSGFASGTTSKEELAECQQLLDAAIKQRPGLAELQVAQGQLELVLNNNVDQALKSFEKAFELGASNLNALALQIRLLAERGRVQEARQRMERIPAVSWSAVLGTTAADILSAVGEKDKAFEEAEKVAKAKPDDPATQTWFADIAVRAEKTDAAEAAMKKAIEINPEDPDAWTRLVSLYLQAKRPNDVERTLREAFLALDDEYLPLLTGKYYELQTRWQEAEDIYLLAYAGRDDDPNVARRLAEFYLQWASANEANRGKAAVYLNKLLKASYEGKLKEGDPSGPWARRQAAKMLAATGELKDLVRAEKLLSAAFDGKGATPEDYDQLVDLLSLRGDPASRQRAVDTLRKVKQLRGGLTPEREIQLGHLLFELGDWEAARQQMLDAIGKFPNDARLQTAYASMLIGRKEFEEAALRITRLAGNPELAGSVNELRLRLASARGDKDEVRNMLKAMTPNLTKLNEEQLKYVRALAQTADGAGDHEYALTLLQEYARRAPDAAIELARMQSLYGNVDEGLASLRAAAPQSLDDSMRIAVEVLRARRDEDPAKLDAAVEQIVRSGLRDDPESARRLVLEAEMLEVQEKFDESIAAYQKLLARDDVPVLVRATALNNLAFILALKSTTPEQLQLALKSANEAIELLGPISDVLDTRALVYLKLQQYDQAAADMKEAVKMNPTASKYYHLAAALLGAGDEAGAVAAWKQAEAESIGPEAVSKLERQDLEGFIKQIEQASAAGATAQAQ